MKRIKHFILTSSGGGELFDSKLHAGWLSLEGATNELEQGLGVYYTKYTMIMIRNPNNGLGSYSDSDPYSNSPSLSLAVAAAAAAVVARGVPAVAVATINIS